jgi:hypothetical protein
MELITSIELNGSNFSLMRLFLLSVKTQVSSALLELPGAIKAIALGDGNRSNEALTKS